MPLNKETKPQTNDVFILLLLSQDYSTEHAQCPHQRVLGRSKIIKLPAKNYEHVQKKWSAKPLQEWVVFAHGPEDRGSIPGRVIPNTQKMVLA